MPLSKIKVTSIENSQNGRFTIDNSNSNYVDPGDAGNTIPSIYLRNSSTSNTGFVVSCSRINSSAAANGAQAFSSYDIENIAGWSHGIYGPDRTYRITKAWHDLNYTSSNFFKIDTSGRVFQPYQPSFYASKLINDNYALTTTTNAAISFPNVKTMGNHVTSGYNSSTYKFTAPVSGNYLFNFALAANSSGSVGDFNFYVNDALYMGDAITIGDYTSAAGGAWKCISISSVIYMNANETCHVGRSYLSQSPTNGQWRALFGGTFLG